ncbi:uncharacterized protein LOC125384153 [Haliotis rufescens]|uniref:uncharacterized protein LOC125384153 n=1 Tax=Haliotis rufescens TaxID=6454 RepID=UPI00201F7467|nr:uncharacterized protein LOC125384153 [Haliotis rufescens]
MTQLIFCLLPNRQRSTYVRLLQKLKETVLQITGAPLQPQVIQTDFEVAVMRDVEEELPGTDIRGCFFHYTQAVWKKVQHLEMVNQYRDNPDIHDHVRRAAALPLLPVNMVQQSWLDAMEDAPDTPQITSFKDYMVNTWVDDYAMFRAGIWNHHTNFGPRNNNHLEGWYAYLNKTVQRAHPNIYCLVRVLQKLEKQKGTRLPTISMVHYYC